MAGKKTAGAVAGTVKKKVKDVKLPKAKPKAAAQERQASTQQTADSAGTQQAGALPSFVFQAPQETETSAKAVPESASLPQQQASNGTEKLDPNRVPTGIPGFDGLIEGGLEREGVVLIGGDSGAGKTIFSLQYLYNGITKFNEPGVYLSFAEPREAIMNHGKRFGWDFEKLEKEKKFAFIRYEPHEVANIVKEGGGLIRDTIDDIGAKRIVVDSVTAYSMFFKTSYEASESLLSLFELVRGWHCTTLLISEELVSLEKSRTDRTEFLADGIIYLYHFRRGDVRTRAIEVLKMRDTNIMEKLCPFRIVEDGIMVFPDTGIFDELKQQF
ncbi:MAG: ATPase domain-containing protein [Candidatus Burarchaeum sp.]|nr:ATPase domain-containing protein [Candidatus Burarchaeum sp.]MDO8339747.1 ATPase domain-containing protein [Candidatus Burarchaeum sp.]